MRLDPSSDPRVCMYVCMQLAVQRRSGTCQRSSRAKRSPLRPTTCDEKRRSVTSASFAAQMDSTVSVQPANRPDHRLSASQLLSTLGKFLPSPPLCWLQPRLQPASFLPYRPRESGAPRIQYILAPQVDSQDRGNGGLSGSAVMR